MGAHRDRFLAAMGVTSLDDEVFPAEGRIDRVVFWPSFGPYCVITVRDLGEVGEVELVAAGLGSHHFLFHDLNPPERWAETQTVSSEALSRFRVEVAEARPEALADVRPDYQYRDGISFEGEVRRVDVNHQFDVHDDRDLWRANPAHERYFLAIWRLAREVLREDWSQRILAPRHYGELLACEEGSTRPRTKRKRS